MADGARFKTSTEVLEWMETGCTPGIHPGLSRMEWILERTGHPERRLKVIHVAGTNGKGSTSAMIASALRRAGYPTGMFISPYLDHWSERIQLDGEPISEESFVGWANTLMPLIEEMDAAGKGRPTPFEFWTLVAIHYFAKEAVPWFVVMETGMGGRFDSTNVVIPLVSVITTVAKDHQAFLGETIREIAAEKAGIIKAGIPVVTSVEDPEALLVITEAAREKQCRLYVAGRDFQGISRESETFDFSGPFRGLEGLELSLRGIHQVQNGAAALMTLEVLRQYYATVLEDEAIREGLATTHWPGRLEAASREPRVLLDCAHNPGAAEALARALRSYTYDRLHLLVAVLEDKDARGIISPLLPLADTVTVTQVNHPRSLSMEHLGAIVEQLSPQVSPAHVGDPTRALEKLRRSAKKEDIILVTGSLYLVAEARRLFQ
ncbi:bifunctional folylpolyglutamate synthase/dihydrofolate synthase [Desmospora profundinema]|uniref:tetrahydrofolate synthase n=1 Tax=Desmospora profundinema TaxID=1571184 RepID=A0ABU1IRQ9_9BACL|nr:folylpolyglutamate synthase/dihydrofolate synthase family protein [Desmospora profundinema]MDR6226435.1 dihydrofolate synthase/folylpolyglutamate synthase [Desmospora profundinema]